MLIHIPVCTHAEPKNILIVGGCNDIRHEIEKHSCLKESRYIDADDAVEALEAMGTVRFDIAAVADESVVSDRRFWIALTKKIDEKGVVSAVMSNIFTHIDEAKEQMKLAGAIYKIVMPYRYEEEIDKKPVSSFMMLSSRFYHPTADINLQRADLTDGFRYYNSDIAVAAFATPGFVNTEYAGIIKR